MKDETNRLAIKIRPHDHDQMIPKTNLARGFRTADPTLRPIRRVTKIAPSNRISNKSIQDSTSTADRTPRQLYVFPQNQSGYPIFPRVQIQNKPRAAGTTRPKPSLAHQSDKTKVKNPGCPGIQVAPQLHGP